MRLKTIRRKGSPFWYVRGTINGERITCSTGATKKEDAERFAREYENKLLDGGKTVSFAYAAQSYADWRHPKEPDVTYIRRLVEVMGDKDVREITHADLVKTADVLHEGRAAATRNRAVLTPASAILHYAASNKWCDWLRVRKFKEPEPKTRFVTSACERFLLIAVQGQPDRQLLFVWLFRQGDRISDILRTRYEDCDVFERTVRKHIGKTDRTVTSPLDDDICSILILRGEEKTGRIFPWKNHRVVDRWIKRLCCKLEISFTPHMARHTVGKQMSDSGASLRVTMDKLGHADVRSSLRYQRGDVESVRTASRLAQKRDKK